MQRQDIPYQMYHNDTTTGINWLGLWTVYYREVWRFMKVYNQTILAPVVTTLIFLAILTLALGGEHKPVEGVPYTNFIAPGLIMMAVVQNAFANSSSSLVLMKIQGVIIDFLMPPLTGSELTVGLVMGGITRGLCVGVAVVCAMLFFVPLAFPHPFIALYFVLSASVMMALLGVLTGVWSQSFDQVAMITNYIITPLAFLSGTFYSIHNLPVFWYHLCHWNPFFYMIDGIRYAMTGYADGNVMLGMAVLLAINVTLWATCQALITRGWRLKS